MTLLNPLEWRTLASIPRRLTPHSAWHEHIPFAMVLVELQRPELIVELGTHYGDSYCAFCQAVDELQLGTQCYAIDTWEGDAHSGFYGAEVLEDLRAHHDPLYSKFSELLQSTFDDALVRFERGSIDLLHIDGFHTYESVEHDFRSWLPKMSDRGIMLFHDINVQEGDFGVWRLWEEVREKYPSFPFLHGHGLGVLAVGRHQAPVLDHLFRATPDEEVLLRNHFSRMGHALTLQLEADSEGRRLRDEIGKRDEAISSLQADLARRKELENHLRDEIGKRDEAISSLQRDISSLRTDLAIAGEALAALRGQLTSISMSRAWRLTQFLWKLRSLLIPPGSRRESLASSVFSREDRRRAPSED